MVKRRRQQVKQSKERSCSVIKKFFKVNFFMKKNWAVHENFKFYQELGDQEIKKHLNKSSLGSHYMSTVITVDEFLKLIKDYLEQELLSGIISAGNFSLLADETTDMADRAVLLVYIRYVDPVNNQVKEVYLGLVEIQDNKGAEALCQKICKVFCAKG